MRKTGQLWKGDLDESGYMGKMLFVDLSKWEIKEELLDEKICYDFIGGYGIGARIIYNLQRAGIDPAEDQKISLACLPVRSPALLRHWVAATPQWRNHP